MASSGFGFGRAHVVHVLVRFHGRTVDERFLPVGRPLRIGSDGDDDAHRHLDATVQVPVSHGGPYVARVMWKGSTCLVQDVTGTVREVGPEPLRFRDGGLDVQLRLARRLALPRLDLPSAGAGLAWAVVVLLSTVFSSQFVWVAENFCPGAMAVLPSVEEVGGPLLWLTLPAATATVAVVALVVANSWRTVVPALVAPLLGLVIPALWTLSGAHWRSGSELLANELAVCIPPPPSGGASSTAFTAEYLARLLRKDYEGEERGVIEDHLDRPVAERDQPNDDGRHFFLPAGAPGPATKMGGAAERTLRPVRTVVVEAEPVVPKKRRPVETPQPTVGDVPLPDAPATDPGADDAAADGADEEQPDEGSEPPSEETEGWGVPGWYDEQDRAAEQVEIDIVLRMAKRRLAIDPDDVGALGILSYYQYLAQDYGAALRTYDRMLAIDPEDAAAYNNKALVYKRMGEYRKEEGLYRQSLNLEPDDTTAMNNLAVNLSHQGRFPEALAIMKELEVIDPDDPYADLHRSKIYAEMGRDEEALRYLEEALQGMQALDTLHHIEFRQDIRIDPSFAKLRSSARFQSILLKYYGKDTPLTEGR